MAILLVLFVILMVSTSASLEMSYIEMWQRIDRHNFEKQQKDLMCQSGILEGLARIGMDATIGNAVWTVGWNMGGVGSRKLMLTVEIDTEGSHHFITSKAYFSDEGEGSAEVMQQMM